VAITQHNYQTFEKTKQHHNWYQIKPKKTIWFVPKETTLLRDWRVTARQKQKKRERGVEQTTTMHNNNTPFDHQLSYNGGKASNLSSVPSHKAKDAQVESIAEENVEKTAVCVWLMFDTHHLSLLFPLLSAILSTTSLFLVFFLLEKRQKMVHAPYTQKR